MTVSRRRRRGLTAAAVVSTAVLLAVLFAHYGPLRESILQAVRDGDCEKVDRLLRWDPALIGVIDTTDPGTVRGRASLLTEASYCRHRHLVGLLVRRGADVNWRGWGLQTALHDLAEYDDGKTMLLLIHRGADVDARDAVEQTPLHCAARAGNRRVAEVLLANGADVNARDKYSKTPLSYAVEEGHDPTADFLRSHGGR